MTDSHEIVRAHVFVSGVVQGVGYRAFVCRQAEHHGLTGWVRNVVDGRVESEVQGNREAVDTYLRDLNRGPMWSSVEHVAIDWMEPGSHESRFEIKY
ncbi:MAG: acylphosphatase [Nitrospinae bacterium]|nr:acylphosphatase [Nitrospinota bacterium]